MSEESINNLEYIDIALHGQPQLSVSIKSAIDEIIADLETAGQKIEESTIREDVKRLLIQEINSLQYSLRHYEIFGHDGIRKEVSKLIGTVITEVGDETSKDGKNAVSRLGPPLRSLIGMLKQVTDWGRRLEWSGGKLFGIIDKIDNLLPPPGV